MRTLGLAVALMACAVLGLAGGATPAVAADATWTGFGDGVNWSDMANWENAGHTGWQTGDPRLTGTSIKLDYASAATTTSTVNIDAQVAPWIGTGRTVTMSASSILNIPTGGKLGNVDGTQIYNPAGGVINVTGSGYFGMDLRPHPTLGNVCGTVNVYSGTYEAARITYVKSATVNIYGSTPTKVYVNDFFSWMDKSAPTLGFTLDAGGVTTFKFDTHGNDSHPDARDPAPVTINVSGIAAYLAGTGKVGDVIPLVRDLNSDLFHPHAWPDLVSVDGDLGLLHRTANGVTLEIITPEPATMALLGLGGIALLIRRKR